MERYGRLPPATAGADVSSRDRVWRPHGLFHVLDKDKFQLAYHVFLDKVKILLVGFGQNNPADRCPAGSQDFSFMPPTGKMSPVSVISPVMAVSPATG